jgi:hypothetical protein
MASGLAIRRYLRPPGDRLLLELSVSELRRPITQCRQNAKMTKLKQSQSGGLHLSIDAESFLMIPLLDTLLVNRHTNHAPYDSVLYDSEKFADGTTNLYFLRAVKMPHSLRNKGFSPVSRVGDGRSSQRSAMSDDAELEGLQILPSASPEFAYGEQVLCPQYALGKPGAVRRNVCMRRYRATLQNTCTSLRKWRDSQCIGQFCLIVTSIHRSSDYVAILFLAQN